MSDRILVLAWVFLTLLAFARGCETPAPREPREAPVMAWGLPR